MFYQNVIALIWDFDKTLSPHYMQRPLFEAYGVDEDQFWREVNALPAYYLRQGVHVQHDTCYLGHLLSYVQHGRFHDLTNARLRELGSQITFFPGIPDILDRLRQVALAEEFRHSDLRIEHYVVSTGISEMIRGSAIAEKLDGVWACEFIETPAPPEYDPVSSRSKPAPISQIAGFLDNTTKTRALFEINKGVNIPEAGVSVNDTIPEEERRVPFQNMIYIADGPSDIPSFSVVRKNGGLAYAVYAQDDQRQFAQAVDLSENNRVNSYGPADYREGTPTAMWLELQITRIARRIMANRKRALESKVGKEPTHRDADER